MSAVKRLRNIPEENAGSEKEAKVIQLSLFSSQEQTRQLTETLWLLAKNAFWFTENFSKSEEKKFIRLLAGHFSENKTHEQNFLELAQRIILAKRYVERRPGRYVAKPQDWLNVNFRMGLAGTANWLDRVAETRRVVPQYNRGILVFSKALLDFSKKPTKENYKKHAEKLRSEKQFSLLGIFHNVIINLQYK